MSIKKHTVLLILFVSIFLLVYCQSNKEVLQTQVLPYKNLHDTVSYVGIETCRSCHQNIYDTFIKTGMGQSFDHATPTKSAASFSPHTTIYDSINNFYYHPHWRNDSLFISEFRLENGDTTYQREQYVKYIIGSGQHTNSHIFEENGYLYQAPITFYTQDQIWDLAPGFEGGFSSRFNRIIGLECMSCHNTLPSFVDGSENKYRHVPQGISCERCHGPGEAHVKEKLAGNIVDTSQYIDYSIVNPSKLPTRELQMNVCQRCHLQGVAILNEGKDFDDFRPAMQLKEVMNVFLPEFDGNETKFIMASQAHRLTKSECYQKSDMTCTSCHNPHVSVKYTARQVFNDACIKCHNPSQDPSHISCTLAESERSNTNNNDCSGCHMPMSGSIDIPHVTIHDHYIRKPIPEAEKNKIENFIGLVSATGPTNNFTRAKGYIHYYESYTADPSLLDTAAYYYQKAIDSPAPPSRLAALSVAVHIYYLQNNMDKVLREAKNINIPAITDAWTAYRIGEAYQQKGNIQAAANFYKQALAIMPLQLDFMNKYGSALLQLHKTDLAVKVYEKLIKEKPLDVSALTNLGFANASLGNLQEAEQLYRQALLLNPDYEATLLNMAGLKLLQMQKNDAKQYVQKVLKNNPSNKDAQQLWKQLIR